jgi:2-dehydropantoate 2-reductase
VATDDPSTLKPHDAVLVTLKATAISGAAAQIASLIAPSGVVAFLLNGIPWWWHYGLPSDAALPLLDPNGTIRKNIDPARVLGVVVYSPNEIAEPGVVVHHSQNRFIFGEPSGSPSERVKALVRLFCESDFSAEVTTNIRGEIWRKLVINAAGNPLAALTRLSAHDRAAIPELAALSVAIRNEVTEIARAWGWEMGGDERDAQVPAASLNRGRPSMLQDILRGRETEVDAILGQVREFGREKGVSSPVIDVILPLVRGLSRASMLRNAR